MPIGVIQKEVNPMNHFTSLGPKQSDQAMEPLGCDILNSEMTTSGLEKMIQTVSLRQSDFQTKNHGPPGFGKVFLLHRQAWQVLV